MLIRLFAAASAVLLWAPGPALAQTATPAQAQSAAPAESQPATPPESENPRTIALPATSLQDITVTADPFAGRSPLESLHPVEVLTAEELEAARGGTLGESLDTLPGVRAATFGAGASRPVIRGQGGPWVRILDEGIGVIDASTISPDHNVASESFSARQIEVLKGPATLMYGSGAIGGVVNMVCDLIAADQPHTALEGSLGARVSSVDSGESLYGHVSGGNGVWSYHLDGLTRRTENYDIPGFAESARLREAEHGEGEHHEGDAHNHEDGHDEHEDEAFGTLPSSATETDSLGGGLTWTGQRGWLGVGVTVYDTVYGIPGHSHAHGEDEGGEGHAEHEGEAHGAGEHGHEHGHEHGEDAEVVLDLEQRRYEMRGGWQGQGWLERVRGALAVSTYEHTEFESEGGETSAGTVFSNDGHEARLEATHAPQAGFRGVFGVQHSFQDFAAIGEESFVPPVETTSTGLFLIEETSLAQWRLSAGLRAEQVDHQASAGPDRDFSLFSASVGAQRALGERHNLKLNLGHAQRAPEALELYANGEHLATQTVETGDPDLDSESVLHFDVGLAGRAGRLDYAIDAFVATYEDYIFAEQTGPANDEGLTPIAYVQDGADFYGYEASVGWALSSAARVALFTDAVRAERDGGADLPRIPADRIGLSLDGQWGALGYGLRLTEVFEQDRATALEGPTDGYTLLAADLSYAWVLGGNTLELALRGRNLLDEEVRNHVSFLKNQVPQPGANVIVEAGWRF